MHFITRLIFLGAIALSQSAWADTGPFFVSSTGYCNVKQVYLDSSGGVYGTEIGCSGLLGTPIVGTFGSDGVVYAATYATDSSGPYPCFRSYAPNGNLVVGCSSGGSIGYTPNARYTVKEAAARSPAIYKFAVSTTMPDLEKIKLLPPMAE